MKHPLYLVYGLLVLVLVLGAELFGWGMASGTEVKNVPRTVRDNPGSYRPHYTYVGGVFRRGK